MFAVKGNIEYSINEAEKNNYLKNGFDILDNNGKKIADGEHKTISYEKYKELETKYASLKQDYEELLQKDNSTELKEQITKKDEELKEKDKKIAELEKKVAKA